MSVFAFFVGDFETVCSFVSVLTVFEELHFVNVTNGPSTHHRTSPLSGQVKLDHILMRRTESEHRQGSEDIHSTIHSSNPSGGDLLASETDQILLDFLVTVKAAPHEWVIRPGQP